MVFGNEDLINLGRSLIQKKIISLHLKFRTHHQMTQPNQHHHLPPSHYLHLLKIGQVLNCLASGVQQTTKVYTCY